MKTGTTDAGARVPTFPIEIAEGADPASADAAIDRPAFRARLQIGTVGKIAISAGLIVYVLLKTEPREIFAAIGGANPYLVGAALLTNFLGYVIGVTRWRVLLRAQGVDARRRYLLQSYMSAIFFNNLLPSTIGGDAVRVFDSWRLGGKKAGALAVIFVDRFLGTLALAFFALVAVIGAYTLPVRIPLLPLWIVGASATLVGLFWLIVVPPGWVLRGADHAGQWLPGRVAKALEGMRAAFTDFQNAPRSLRQAFGLSVLLQANVVLHFYLLVQALALSVPVTGLILIIPIALAIMAIPISINAIGIRENVFAFFFGMYAVTTAEALAFAWVAYGLVVTQGVLGGIVYGLRRV